MLINVKDFSVNIYSTVITCMCAEQCCGSGVFLSRIRISNFFFIPDPAGEKAPDPGSRIPDPTVHKNRDEKTFFLLFIDSGASFI
jgi:hypothetical protein